jgi:cytochrome c556
VKLLTKVSSCVLGALLFASSIQAQSDHHAHHEQPKKQGVSLELSEPVRNLLRQEMQQVRVAMQSLVSALATADWKNIEKLGKGIEKSFILKQKISKEQMHELHSALPAEFKRLDKKFHYYAGMLAHVAKEKDAELTQFYFSKMTESCMSCHSQFATKRFPGYLDKNKHESKGHH